MNSTELKALRDQADRSKMDFAREIRRLWPAATESNITYLQRLAVRAHLDKCTSALAITAAAAELRAA